MLIDTHCHLDAPEFDDNRDLIIARARAGGVGAMIVPAVSPHNFDAVAALAHTHRDIVYALGIHPLWVDRLTDDALQLLEQALVSRRGDPKLVAVGEIGLDYFVPGLDVARQEVFYEAQLLLARRFDLPVILHVRKSQDRLLKYLRKTSVSGGIAHAFNGSTQQARAFTELGFALGFGGTLTFERARQIRRLVGELPGEAHVLETDAPDMAPAWLARERNEPGELPAIARQFAQLRPASLDEVIEQTYCNALRVIPGLKCIHRPPPVA
ncbi:MAG: TatD family hydrolase [Burkholderiaceae bacterium]